MVSLVLAREDRVAHCKLSHNAAEAPHVDARRVRNAQDNLRRSVESGLDVGIDAFILEARRSKVNDFDSRLGRVLQKYVLWL